MRTIEKYLLAKISVRNYNQLVYTERVVFFYISNAYLSVVKTEHDLNKITHFKLLGSV